MPNPTYETLVGPLLKVLADEDRMMRPPEASDAVADAIGLSEEDRRELVPSGSAPIYRNRVGWAHDALKRNGLSHSPRYGHWQITDAGRALLAEHGGSIPEEVGRELASKYRNTPLAKILGTDHDSDAGENGADKGGSGDERGVLSPEEKIEAGLREIETSVARELLEAIWNGTPEFFEQVVLDVLFALGYGGDRSALQRVGGSGDGGIDGIISIDALGLEKVYVQAKRYRGDNQVGSPAIQGFVGALQLQRATKGVFITSSYFSKPALELASLANIVLINGDQLARLMIDHEVGVSTRSIKIPKVDSDYFEG